MNYQETNLLLNKVILEFQEGENQFMIEAAIGSYSIPSPGQLSVRHKLKSPEDFGLKQPKVRNFGFQYWDTDEKQYFAKMVAKKLKQLKRDLKGIRSLTVDGHIVHIYVGPREWDYISIEIEQDILWMNGLVKDKMSFKSKTTVNDVYKWVLNKVKGLSIDKTVKSQESAIDVTKDVLNKAYYTWNTSYDKRFGGSIKPAVGKLNKSQQVIMKMVGIKGLNLPFISNALLFSDEFYRLKKSERKAVLALVMGGKLKVLKVAGSLPGIHKPSKIGANAEYHYRLKKV